MGMWLVLFLSLSIWKACPDDGAICKVITVNPEGNVNICVKFHGNSCWQCQPHGGAIGKEDQLVQKCVLIHLGDEELFSWMKFVSFSLEEGIMIVILLGIYWCLVSVGNSPSLLNRPYLLLLWGSSYYFSLSVWICYKSLHSHTSKPACPSRSPYWAVSLTTLIPTWPFSLHLLLTCFHWS